MIRDQLPVSGTFYPDKSASIFAADGLPAVLSFERDAAGRYCAILIHAHRNIFLLVDGIQRGRARLKVRQTLRLCEHVSCRVNENIIVGPDFLQRSNVALQYGVAISVDHLSDLLLAGAVRWPLRGRRLPICE